MSKSIKKIVLPLVLVAMLLVSACITQAPTAEPITPPEPTLAPTEPVVEEPTVEPTEEVVAEPTSEPIVIVDVIGREVTPRTARHQTDWNSQPNPHRGRAWRWRQVPGWFGRNQWGAALRTGDRRVRRIARSRQGSNTNLESVSQRAIWSFA